MIARRTVELDIANSCHNLVASRDGTTEHESLIVLASHKSDLGDVLEWLLFRTDKEFTCSDKDQLGAEVDVERVLGE